MRSAPALILPFLALALVGCSDPPCVERDTAVAASAFEKCLASGTWTANPGQCRLAAETVSCKRYADRLSPTPTTPGDR